jgi:pimeloyl-ACP methyl ester carboxylesterase
VTSEKPIVFGQAATLVGITATPSSDRPSGRAVPAFVFVNAGIVHRAGPNRLYVHLARALAEHGVPSLRFDLGGIGDSIARRQAGTMDELVHRDITDAIDAATREFGCDGVVLVGLCSGADHAFQAATRDARVVGAVLIDPDVHRTRGFYLRHFRRALTDRTTWRLLLTGRHPLTSRIAKRLGRYRNGNRDAVSTFLAPTTLLPQPAIRSHIADLLNRNCRMLYVFTGGLPWRYNHERQFERTYPDVAFGDCIKLKYFGDSDHTFSPPMIQKQLMEDLVRWVSAEPFPAPDKSISAA